MPREPFNVRCNKCGKIFDWDYRDPKPCKCGSLYASRHGVPFLLTSKEVPNA